MTTALSEFKEMVDESVWKQEENTMQIKNNAFGKIVFDVEECVDEAQYMRIAKVTVIPGV